MNLLSRSIHARGFVLGILFCVSVGAIANDAAGGKPIDGHAIFQKNCSVCHGDAGNADTRAAGSFTPRPRNFTTPEAAIELTRERMINSVTNGRPGTAMVAHKKKLSPQQIEAVVDYIRSTFMKLPSDSGKSSASASAIHANERGMKIFKRNCAACHGDQGNTAVWAQNGLNPPPRDFTAPEAKLELTRERMVNSVTNGRPGTAMMPFRARLTKQDIEAVVDYIRANFMQVPASKAESVSNPVVEPTTAPQAHVQSPPMGAVATNKGAASTEKINMSDLFPNKLRGDVKRGRAFFMSNCYMCHGTRGDGNGPRAYFIAPRPRNFTSEQSRANFNRPKLYDSISRGKVGTVMPAWGKVLSEQQIADVAEFVFQGFILGKLKMDDAADDVGGDEKKKVE